MKFFRLFYLVKCVFPANAAWQNLNSEEGPKISINIPPEINEKGKQFDRVELARKMAAARSARKEEDRVIGHQLSWESILPLQPVETDPEIEEENVNVENQGQFEDNLPDVKRFVHMDFAAAPPNTDYLKKIFELLKEIGTNGVFLEYESSFPFDSELAILTNPKRSYDTESLKIIQDLTKEMKLEVAPYIDVCSNAFYITKHFKNLRVGPDCLMDLNPLSEEVKVFVLKIVDAMMQAHPTSGWIHLGCEKFESLHNNRLVSEIRKRNTTEELVYLDYIESIASRIKLKHPSVRPLIWDDMMRKIKPETLMDHKAPDYFDVVIRSEQNGVSQDARALLKLIQRHGKIFDGLWLASNYKCGKDPVETLPDVKKNAVQAEEMFQAAKSAPVYANIVGFFISGPSRWSHFAAMCTLLPSSLPSLVSSFITMNRGAFSTSVLWESSRKLGFQLLIPTVYKPRPQEVIPGNFPGSEVWRSTQLMENIKGRVHSFLYGANYNSFFNKYLIKSGKISYYRVETIDKSLDTLIKDLNMTKMGLIESMKEMYDADTINEWIIEQIAAEEEQLEETRKLTQSQLAIMKQKL